MRANSCGKLVVATSDDQIPTLERLKAHAENNSVAGLEMVGRDDIRRREPHVAGAAALWSPNSGRVEAEGLVRALRRLGAARDAVLLCATPLTGVEETSAGIKVRTAHETIATRCVVNAAGLYADEVSKILGGETFRIYPCRGDTPSFAPRAAGG